jgi:hypothetical protein
MAGSELEVGSIIAIASLAIVDFADIGVFCPVLKIFPLPT